MFRFHIKLWGCNQKGASKKNWYPKMDGENNGKPYAQMDDLGVVSHYFWKHLNKKAKNPCIF